MAINSQMDRLMFDLATITKVAGSGVVDQESPSLDWGQTRPAAVVYLDVVGFTELSTELPSQPLSRLIDRSFRIFELTAQSRGGYCDKVVGDAALYVFPGHPNHPPPCEGALRAALNMLERLAQINRSLASEELELEVRIGVSYGEVTRKRVGSEDADPTVMGKTVNLAQRLESAAESNTVLTVARVLERADEVVRSEPAGERLLKGIGELKTHRVTGIEERPVRLRGSFRRLSPLVGRGRELEQCSDLLRGWLTERDGQRRNMLLIRGPAAVGKSRLAWELTERLSTELDFAPARMSFTERTGLTELTAKLAGIAGLTPDNLVERWAELCNDAEQIDSLGEVFAERARRQLRTLGMVLESSEVDYAGLQAADPDSFLLNCKLALSYCLDMLAEVERTPLLLVLEDLQWMETGAELIHYLLTKLETERPVVVLATARPEYEHAASELGEEVLEKLELDRLQRESGDRLLGELLPGVELPESLQDQLHTRAEGLPYYYEEFARMLMRKGLVRETETGYRLDAAAEELALPEDLTALVLGRLDGLPEDLRKLVGRASVLGRSFSGELLEELDGRLGIGGADHPEASLERLAEHNILGRGEDGEWRFEHAITRQAAHSALLVPTSNKLHRLCAELLKERITPGTRSELELTPQVVDHLDRAGCYREAHEGLAGLLFTLADAGRLEGWEERESRARELWERAREEDSELPELSLWLERARGMRFQRLGEPERSEEHYRSALETARALADREAEATVLRDLSTNYQTRGEVELATEHCEHSLELAEQLGEAGLRAGALLTLGTLSMTRGFMDRTREHYERGLGAAREAGDRRTETKLLGNLGLFHHNRGNNEQAEDYYQRALELAREVGDRRSVGILLGSLAGEYRNQGRFEEAEDHYHRALESAREIGGEREVGLWQGGLGDLHLARGEFRAADRRYRKALESARERDDGGAAGAWLSALGRTGTELGELDRAEEQLTRAGEILGRPGNTHQLGYLECHWVHFHLASGSAERAADCLQRAEETAEKLGAGAESKLGRKLARAREALNGPNQS